VDFADMEYLASIPVTCIPAREAKSKGIIRRLNRGTTEGDEYYRLDRASAAAVYASARAFYAAEIDKSGAPASSSTSQLGGKHASDKGKGKGKEKTTAKGKSKDKGKHKEEQASSFSGGKPSCLPATLCDLRLPRGRSSQWSCFAPRGHVT
jgi:hypothetical protein